MKFKLIALVLLFLFNIKKLKAQSYDAPLGIRFGIGGGLGITTNQSPYGYAININPQIEYQASEFLSLSLVTGYTRLLTKDTSPIADYDFIPLKLEIKIFPIIENLYAVGLVGAGFGLIKNAKTSLIYGGGLGYQFLNGYSLGVKFERYQQSKNSVTYQAKTKQLQLSFAYFF